MATSLSPDSLVSVSSQSPKTCYEETNVSYTMCQYDIPPDILSRSFNITLKVSSPATSSGPFCRICHEGDLHEDLLSLCKCTGSVGLVHLRCLERWLSTRRGGHDKCEICNYAFQTVRSPKSIAEWYQSDGSHRTGIYGDIACFAVISPLAIISSVLCLQAAKKHVVWNNSLEAGSLVALATFLLTIYIVWNVLTLRYHFRSYSRWRSVNQNVRLVCFRRKPPDGDNSPQSINVTQNTENGISISVSTCRQVPLSNFQPSSQQIGVNAQRMRIC